MNTIYRAALLMLLFVTVSFNQPAKVTGYKPGDKASDFLLKDVSGRLVSLASYRDAKGFIIVFTCNHCPFSQAYEDRIIALHNKYVTKGYPVVAINPNDAKHEPEDSFENMVKRAKEKRYPFAYLHDETQEVAALYGAARTPHVFILERSKGTEMTVVYIGAIDDNFEEPKDVKIKYAEVALNALLSGKSVPTPLTKAIGCTIKWKK